MESIVLTNILGRDVVGQFKQRVVIVFVCFLLIVPGR